MPKLKVGPDNRNAITEIATSLRRRSEQLEPPYSTRQIIETCFPGTVVTGRMLDRATDEVVQVDQHAFRSHRAPHIIVYNRRRSTAARRYAIAHALAHIIFDGKRWRNRHANPDAELRCDRFADELLVPLAVLREYVCKWPDDPDRETFLDMRDQIASHFHVPSKVIARQIAELRRAA